ncbi:hypothetical protein AB0A74_00605 [Saccharothrix sp. NPDC042600]|uniref:hypothetical protein n=1 Tax=Saccharothrix TaxID=2071 RepID=UPI0033EA4C4A|nr:hypothetical protein GCM10017745_48050 [Saccharothrix mutabilis subsp. capreolus]
MTPARTAQMWMVRAAVAAGDYPARPAEALVARLADDPTGDADRALGRFLAAVLCLRGPDVHGYLAGRLGYSPERPVPQRHHCGRHLLVVRMEPHELPAAARDFYVCERCGPAVTTPADVPAPEVALEGPGTARITLRCPTPAAGWVAAGMQPIGRHPEPHDPPRRVPAGTTELTLRLPERKALGLRRFAVALVCAGDFVVVQFPLEG